MDGHQHRQQYNCKILQFWQTILLSKRHHETLICIQVHYIVKQTNIGLCAGYVILQTLQIVN